MADSALPVPQVDDPILHDAPPVSIPDPPAPPAVEPEPEPEPAARGSLPEPAPEPEPEPDDVSILSWIAGGGWRERLGRSNG